MSYSTRDPPREAVGQGRLSHLCPTAQQIVPILTGAYIDAILPVLNCKNRDRDQPHSFASLKNKKGEKKG